MLREDPTHRFKRTLRVEALERRCMLSLSPLPTAPVVAVPIAVWPAALVGAATPAVTVAKPKCCCHHDAAPVISDFTVVQKGGVMTLSGTVSDADGPVAGLKVHIGGVLAKYHLTATVNEDGTFSVCQTIPRERHRRYGDGRDA